MDLLKILRPLLKSISSVYFSSATTLRGSLIGVKRPFFLFFFSSGLMGCGTET